MAVISNRGTTAERRGARQVLGYHVRLVALAIGVIVGVIGGVGCGVEAPPGHGQPIGAGGAGGEGGAIASGGSSCPEGETRDCHVTLGKHGNILSCYDGVQVCTNGAWGPCGEGEVSSRTMPGADESAAPDDDPSAMPGAEQGVDPAGQHAPEGIGSTPLALSDAGPCVGNPCDPTCQSFDEKPINGGLITATSWVAGGWIGLKNRAPPGLLGKAWSQPCNAAEDCQFGFYCDNPTSGSCSHHKCATGSALSVGCDSCVDEICAKYPSCCTAPAGVGTCAHSPCTTGTKLTAGCDAPASCVSQICAKDPTCCSGSWTQKCADMVSSVCGQSCPGWSQTCVDAVHDVCGAFCQDPPTAGGVCAHSPCYTGAALDPAACGKCTADVCKTRPSCCTNAWDATCTTLVPSVCGVACPPQGACKQWVAGETDEDCNGVDLVQGVPCNDSSGKNQIVVCNVGTKQAPVGIEAIVFPGNSGKIGNCNPGGGFTSCGKTTKPIAPGACVDLECPAVFGANEEVMINPPGPNYVPECQCKNNWALFTAPGGPIKCEVPLCSGTQTGVIVKKPNLYFAVDRSSAIPSTDFDNIKKGIKAFLEDQSNFLDTTPKFPLFYYPQPGIGVELSFFPDVVSGNDCSTSTCDATKCLPRVTQASAFSTTPPSDTQEQTLVTALGATPQDPGAASSGPALAAALTRASDYYIVANNINVNAQPILPGEDATVVLFLASEPPNCGTTTASLAGLAATTYATWGIKTYVIGVGVSKATVDAIATAGGGVGYTFPLGAGLDTSIAAALKAIRFSLFPCTFPLPEAGLYDQSTAVFTYGPGGYSAAPMTLHADPSQCNPAPGNTPSLMGYYFVKDANGNPVAAQLCDATCKNVNSDTGGGVRLRLQCAGTITSEVYQGTCPAGTKPQWGFFAYDTSTPNNTKVTFQARVAQTKAGLNGAPFVALATAQSVALPATNKCLLGGPAPCPIDLVKKFGGVSGAQADWLELKMTLTPDVPTQSTPTVSNWQLTYSCPPTE